VITVLQAEWHLMYVLNGPVPRIFAPEPAMAKVAIENDPTKAFKDIQRIHSHIFMSEHVMPEDVWQHGGNCR
jgi:hypothetical protein